MDKRYFQNLYPFDVLLNTGQKLYAIFPYVDISIIQKLLKDFPEKGVAVEIGSWTGHSTCFIGSLIKEKKGHLSTIDSFVGIPDIENDVGQVRGILDWNLERCGVKDCVSVLEGASDDFVSTFDDESIDFMFIDGDHRYSQISKDIRNWMPKIKIGGIISGHDYNGPMYNEEHVEKDCFEKVHHGVTKALSELSGVHFFQEGGKQISSVWFINKESCDFSPTKKESK